MRERPILFSAPMVRGLLAGTKTQTRRTIKKPFWQGSISRMLDGGVTYCDDAGSGQVAQHCPYGQPGDRLWVCETWRHDDFCGEMEHTHECIIYAADHNAELLADTKGIVKWRPSIFMPRWASRITLEVTEVRVQRLSDISAADCYAEGIIWRSGFAPYGFTHRADGPENGPIEHFETEIEAYRKLWESINGASSWDLNPWIWAISFKVVSA